MPDSLCKSEAGSPAERRGVLTSRIVYRAPRSTKGVIYGASVCLHHPPDSFERESGNRPAGIVTNINMQRCCCVSFFHGGGEYSNTAMGCSLFDVAAKALEFFCSSQWKGPRPRRN